LKSNKQRGQLYTLAVNRKKRKKERKIDYRWQSNHYKPTNITPCGRGHGYASREMADCQIWPSGGVT